MSLHTLCDIEATCTLMNGRMRLRWIGRDLGGWDLRLIEPVQPCPMANLGISDTETSSYYTTLLLDYFV